MRAHVWAHGAPGPQIREKWSGSLSGTVRLARFWTLLVGLTLEAVIATVGKSDVVLATLAAGMALFVATTVVTWTAAFTKFHLATMTAIPLADFVTLALFDFLPGPGPVAALVAVPAMWLGFVLGRLGIAVATLFSVVILAMPGLLYGGTGQDTVIDEIAAVLFAVVASAGLALSTETWARQLARLEKQAAQLERASRVRDDFIATVSHELRTPLTSIIGYLEVIQEDLTEAPHHIASSLDAMDRNADRLLHLVTDLLSVVEVEQGTLSLNTAPTDMSRLVQASVDDLSQRATDAGLRLTCDIEPGLVVIADPGRIGQVVDNLMSNALKYTPAPGEVSVHLHQSAGGIDLTVRDTGIGVPAQDLDSLGTKFFRTQTATEMAIPGVGVGLTLTKSIISAHGGSLEFVSREGHGTSVRVVLPTRTGLLHG